MRLQQRRPAHRPATYLMATAVLVTSLALPWPSEAAARSTAVERIGIAVRPVLAATTADAARMQQPPSVVLRYYFALFFAGPYGCLDFMDDGTIVGSQPTYFGTYVGLPWLSIFSLDSGHTGITFGPVLFMQRADGIWGLGFAFDVWGINCVPPA